MNKSTTINHQPAPSITNSPSCRVLPICSPLLRRPRPRLSTLRAGSSPEKSWGWWLKELHQNTIWYTNIRTITTTCFLKQTHIQLNNCSMFTDFRHFANDQNYQNWSGHFSMASSNLWIEVPHDGQQNLAIRQVPEAPHRLGDHLNPGSSLWVRKMVTGCESLWNIMILLSYMNFQHLFDIVYLNMSHVF